MKFHEEITIVYCDNVNFNVVNLGTNYRERCIGSSSAQRHRGRDADEGQCSVSAHPWNALRLRDVTSSSDWRKYVGNDSNRRMLYATVYQRRNRDAFFVFHES